MVLAAVLLLLLFLALEVEAAVGALAMVMGSLMSAAGDVSILLLQVSDCVILMVGMLLLLLCDDSAVSGDSFVILPDIDGAQHLVIPDDKSKGHARRMGSHTVLGCLIGRMPCYNRGRCRAFLECVFSRV